MKNLLVPKNNRLLIKFKSSKNLNERIESFRTTSVEKAQKIINRRNQENILAAFFGIENGVIYTDKNLVLSKIERV